MSPSKLFLLFAAFLFVSCMDQYDPSDYLAQLAKEEKRAGTKIPVLTKDGKIPTGDEASGESFDVAAKYAALCASCHGAKGAGDGAAGAALNPKPRAFTDKEWQASVKDDFILKVIRDGGSAVGMSSAMAAWGALLKPAELTKMVEYVRGFGK